MQVSVHRYSYIYVDAIVSFRRNQLQCWANLKHLCAWGNDAASEVLTEARLLLVENYFQTPSLAWATLRPSRISGRAPSGVKLYNS
ncbi:hypothetical protein Pint_12843 [Pistacia integerrima]|uniref:Uncharacterized protein n=1 Tax=Pistacia integerrima TaxID=434235 RepID=A0ACC0Y753_9ROSI|nr:hypothetical protein Pint_12843 [Pistacia integerrima]